MHKSNVIHHISRHKDKSYLIISFNAEKVVEKSPTFLCDKSSSESKNTEDYFYELKAVYSRRTTNILLNVEKN